MILLRHKDTVSPTISSTCVYGYLASSDFKSLDSGTLSLGVKFSIFNYYHYIFSLFFSLCLFYITSLSVSLLYC